MSNRNKQKKKDNKKRQRSRNISWFNPPFSENVSTNLGRKFFNLLDRCFPPKHKLHKLLNRNTVKLSYCCMPSVKQIITAHNRSILHKAEPRKPDEKTCNCKVKPDYPLQGNCLATSIIYQASITRHDNSHKETYIGLTANSFKTRYNNHMSNFQVQR